MSNSVAGWQGVVSVWGRWLLAVLVLSSQWAAARANDSVDGLLIASGVDAQMSVFEKMVQGTLTQNPALEEEQRAVLQHIAMESFRSDVIYRYVRAAVAEALQPGDRETLSLWYSSPLGQRITTLELKGLEADAFAAMKAAAEALSADQERMAAAARLDALTQASGLGMALQQRAMLANYMAEAIAANPDAPVDTTALEAQLQQHRETMQQLIQQQTLLSLAFTYRELPLEKIASYESFLSTSASRRFQQGVQDGLLRGGDVVLEGWEGELREFYRGD